MAANRKNRQRVRDFERVRTPYDHYSPEYDVPEIGPGYWSYGRDYWTGRDYRPAYPAEYEDITYRGVGPTGYRRSDERILDDVCATLSDDALLDASKIEVSVENGEITLDGSVKDRWDKRYAETIVDTVFGVKDVHNRLRLESKESPEKVRAA